MTKIYFLAFLALLVFVAVSAQEQEQEQVKETILDLQFENPEEYDCSTNGCRKVCERVKRPDGFCFMGKCLCILNVAENN
ncbi:hypothetical protein HZH66_007166 [Vespula vulgaris]|uniref:Uncharacterized protein n=1 Tax=Vespula vulgaris TaxID=7454 RepID=A0A834N613_VESVU|nr:hypothetical protein HZH66_007166 [Vespula vulgaris]